jgi:glyoxylase-like metal-dependent hydrolase (beta-lactamase superfamily II)
MKVHHLNSGTFRPMGGRLVSDDVRGLRGARAVSHCLLIVTESAGLILVDTGPGASLRSAGRTVELMFNAALRPDYVRSETPTAQVKRLGFDPADVRHILLTHLDPDHIGGLVEFPWAQVHLAQRELDAAVEPRYLRERAYSSGQWAHGVDWAPISDSRETWKGVPNARTIDGLPEEIVAVALPGHTRGHTGYAIERGGEHGAKWLLHGGDSHFSRFQIDPDAPKAPPMIRAFYRLAQYDPHVQQQTLARLIELHDDPDVDIICSHDPFHIDTRQVPV